MTILIVSFTFLQTVEYYKCYWTLTLPPVGVWSVAITVSVCLSAHISQKPHVQTSQNLLYMLTVAVAQSSSDDNAIHNVFPVLWMTSFHTTVPMKLNQTRHYLSPSLPRGPIGQSPMSTTALFLFYDPLNLESDNSLIPIKDLQFHTAGAHFDG